MAQIGIYIEDNNLFEQKYSKKTKINKNNASDTREKLIENSAINLISYYIIKINDNDIHFKLYSYLIKYFKESKMDKNKALSILKNLILSSGDNPDDFLPQIEEIFENNEENSNGSFNKFKSIISNNLVFKNTPKHQIRDDLHQAMNLINKNNIWFKLEVNNQHKYHLEAAKAVENEFTIKRVDNDNYYFNDNHNFYESLNPSKLGVLVRNNHMVSLKNKQFQEILGAIQRNDKDNPYYWNFKNGIYDITKHKIISGNKKDNFTIKNAGLLDMKTGKFTGFQFDESVDITPNFSINSISPVQKVIQEILIPKYDENDTDLYYDFLQRLGASFLPINKYKSLTMYIGDGDNGKSMLLYIGQCIFNNHFATVRTEQIKNDNFLRTSVLKRKNFIALDELDENSFKGIQSELKQMCGGGILTNERKMYSEDVINSSEFGMIWFGTNKVPKFDYSDTAFLKRLDILELPNEFVNKDTLENNQYSTINKIKDIINKDILGLEWLVNASLKAYKVMVSQGEEFKCKQKPSKTLKLATLNNPIDKFLNENLQESINLNDLVANEEIRSSMLSYFDENNIDIGIDDRKLSIKIGNSVSKLFPKANKIRTADSTKYNYLKFIN